MSLLLLAGACAEGAALDDDDDVGPIGADPDGSAADARTRDASGSSSSSSSSSGGASSGSSSSSGDAGNDASLPLTACQQALSTILFDVEASTPPERGTSWSVGVTDGVTGTWPFQPWAYSTPTDTVIPTACAASSCIGTTLSNEYAQCQRGWTSTPEADLSACAGEDVVVKFDQAYAFNDYGSTKDGGIVEVTGNGADFSTATWTRLDGPNMGTVQIRGSFGGESCLSSGNFYVNGKRGYVGSSTTTHTAELELPAAALTAHARIRFVFASGVAYAGTDANESRNHTKFGWRIDNVRFEQRL